MAIRLIVCFDFDTDSIPEAYKALLLGLSRQHFGTNEAPSLGWETSDEAYDFDTGGEGERKIPEPELTEAICGVLSRYCSSCGQDWTEGYRVGCPHCIERQEEASHGS